MSFCVKDGCSRLTTFGRLAVNKCFEYEGKWFIKLNTEYLGMGDISPNCFCYQDSILLEFHESTYVTQIDLKIEEV